jgi:hypothetical protein
MGILDEIASTILNDSLFNSALTEWVRVNHIDDNNSLYVLLSHDDRIRTEIAKTTVKYISKYVGDWNEWKRTITRDVFLGNHLKTIFEGLKMLSELPMEDNTFLTPVAAWHHWKLQSTHTDMPMTNMNHLLSELP